jgi:hypothetical protein
MHNDWFIAHETALSCLPVGAAVGPVHDWPLFEVVNIIPPPADAVPTVTHAEAVEQETLASELTSGCV